MCVSSFTVADQFIFVAHHGTYFVHDTQQPLRDGSTDHGQCYWFEVKREKLDLSQNDYTYFILPCFLQSSFFLEIDSPLNLFCSVPP
jgi:hypothetical protein